MKLIEYGELHPSTKMVGFINDEISDDILEKINEVSNIDVLACVYEKQSKKNPYFIVVADDLLHAFLKKDSGKVLHLKISKEKVKNSIVINVVNFKLPVRIIINFEEGGNFSGFIKDYNEALSLLGYLMFHTDKLNDSDLNLVKKGVPLSDKQINVISSPKSVFLRLILYTMLLALGASVFIGLLITVIVVAS